MAVKEKVLDLANKISRVKRGSKDEIKPEYPEYRILEPVVTEEMAEVALHLAFREPRTAAEIAALCGKPLEETSRLLWDLAVAGVCFVNEIDGVDKYWHDLWVPGHMEIMVNNRENVRKFPQIAEAFDAFGKRRGPKTVGNFPVGTGLMRVIPIEKTIEGETRRASYEEVSRYLEENTVFSVSDCSCRTSREAMGEGCGHPKEEMCIQMGHAAEYYIRTGRARAITREEAYEIIRKAEENGLVHQIPNTDGPGKTHAICNCCGCGCFSLRIAGHFRNPDMLRSNYVSVVDADKCVACGECVENCPTNALKLGKKVCEPEAPRHPESETPRDNDWGPDRWNPEYRVSREVVLGSGTSPCKAECPAHIGVQGYVKLASQGRYAEALELIKKENPFPAVCGRICPRKCESACTRGEIDDPVAVDEIKKFVAELDLRSATRYVPKKRHEYGNRIAVVGSGPSGLSCAYFLALDGYRVTVFERERRLGGMLGLGIPAFRLEKDVVEAEIEVLRELGVEFRTGVEVGKDRSLAELRKDGFEAFYLAVGASAGRRLGIPGEEAEGVETGVAFLRRVNLGEPVALSGRVVVIGGGNVAVDVARSALRVGAASVTMACLESREGMPALAEELEEALHEGVAIDNGWGPTRIVLEGGRVVGVEFRRCLSVLDAEGRFAPTYDDSARKLLPADSVLVSVGQAMDWGSLLEGSRAELNRNGTIKADPLTLQTGEPDLFAGGDALTGPRFAIDAIAQGKEAAVSIHRYVHPGHSLTLGRVRRDYRAFETEGLEPEGYDRSPRQRALAAKEPAAPAAGRAAFLDGRGTFTEEQVKAETARCLSCGASARDEFMCVGCGVCVTKCKFDAVRLERRYDASSVEFERLKPKVLAHMIKRRFRIAARKLGAPLRSGWR